MKYYVLNSQAQFNGDHEIHTMQCRYLPMAQNRIGLGYFDKDEQALREARRYFARVDGCIHCCPSIHRS